MVAGGQTTWLHLLPSFSLHNPDLAGGFASCLAVCQVRFPWAQSLACHQLAAVYPPDGGGGGGVQHADRSARVDQPGIDGSL